MYSPESFYISNGSETDLTISLIFVPPLTSDALRAMTGVQMSDGLYPQTHNLDSESDTEEVIFDIYHYNNQTKIGCKDPQKAIGHMAHRLAAALRKSGSNVTAWISEDFEAPPTGDYSDYYSPVQNDINYR